MTRWMVGLALLLLAGAQSLEAQQCVTSRGRRVCYFRDRDRYTSARAPVQFGVRGGYDFQDDVGSGGAQVRVPLVPQLLLVPNADVFFDSDGGKWQLNTDVVLRPYALAGVYGGVGLAFANRDFDTRDVDDDTETRAGFNLIVGLDGGRISGSSVHPFVEGRWTHVDDYRPFRLVAGINVPISGRY